jgi:putative transposase
MCLFTSSPRGDGPSFFRLRFSLTPAFRPVMLPGMDTSRFSGLPSQDVAHSYSRCWIHLIWGTLNRQKLLNKDAASRVSRYLSDYAVTKGIYIKINFVNADHVHALVELPTSLSIEDLVQLFKGSSSHWINANNVVARTFAWGRGYGAFSVSESNVDQVAAYIAEQELHHRLRPFSDELKEFIKRHGLRWQGEESR